MVTEEEIRIALMSKANIDKADVDATSRATEALKTRFSSTDNIHTHTPFIGATCRSSLIPIDDKYGLSREALSSFEETVNEIKEFCSSDARVVDILGRISGSEDIEPETGLNMKDILIRSWAIAKNVTLVYENKGLIIDALKHNIDAGGGCLAGISGRLVAPYSLLVNQVMTNTYNFQRFGALPQTLQSKLRHEDSELELAIAISMGAGSAPQDRELEEAIAVSRAMAHSRGGAGGGKLDEDTELARAMSLSFLSSRGGGSYTSREAEESKYDDRDPEDMDFLIAQRMSIKQHSADLLKEQYVAMGYSYEDAAILSHLQNEEDETLTAHHEGEGYDAALRPSLKKV
jgi:hypothetical protein